MRSVLSILVTIVVVAVATAGGWFIWKAYANSPWTRDARVRANVVNVAPDVAGPIIDIKVKDNQHVAIGDVLFVVDQARYRLALSQAQASLDAAKSVAEQRQDEFQRRERLSATSISIEALNQARSAAAEAEANYAQAEASLEVAKLNMARTTVHSPVNGHVTNLLVEPGDYAMQGRAVLAIVDEDSFYVAGYFEETKLPLIKIGDKVSIRLIGWGPELDGHVESIARAITDRDNVVGGDLVANVNPTFSWVRLAQRIPVRIAIDKAPKDATLSAGMTATVVVRR